MERVSKVFKEESLDIGIEGSDGLFQKSGRKKVILSSYRGLRKDTEKGIYREF